MVRKGIKIPKINDTLIAWCTLIIAISAVIGIGFTYSQLKESDKITADTFKRMDNAISAFKTLAEATQKSVSFSDSSFLISKRTLDFSKKSVEIENRPFVIIEGYSDYLPDIGKRGGGLNIVVKNLGHTPAYITYATGIILTTKEDFIKKMKTIYTPKKLDFIASACKQHLVLGADQSTSLTDSAKLNITKDDYMKMALGKMNLYIYGDIQYMDFFGNHYYTHFCGLLDYSTTSFSLIGDYNKAN